MYANPYPGKFVVFEGPDGSGHTTQAQRLFEALRAEKNDVVITAEPTNDSPAGVRIHEIIARRANAAPDELQMLFVEDRRIHLEQLIIPALTRGATVISDRYSLSTIAFGSLSCDMKWLTEINKDFILPDLTLIILARAEVCVDRISKRGTHFELFETIEKLQKVNDHYRSLAAEYGNTFIIDGERSIDEVSRDVWEKARDVIE